MPSRPPRSGVVNAYQLAVVATMLPCAALGDLLSPRKGVPVGPGHLHRRLGAVRAGAHAGAAAAARVLQGVGAAGVMSVNIALIQQIFPPTRLGRGVGMNALVVGMAFALGPTVASLLLAVGSWHWLFGINLPLGLLALAFAVPSLPRAPQRGHGFDRLTAVLTATTCAALIFALSSAAQREAWPQIAVPLLLCVASGAWLLRRQAGHPAPMLPVT